MKKAASVFLRADINENDTKSLLKWLNDPETIKYLSDDRKSVSELHHLINNVPDHLWRMHLCSNGYFYMIDRGDKAIGFVRLSEINDVTYEVVIALGDKSIWGQGYGTAALKNCLNIAFFERRAHQIVAHIYPENVRSLRLFEKHKFVKQKHCSSVIRYVLTYDQHIS